VVTGSQVAVLSGHTDWVRSITFSSDGTSLVSESHDKTLKLWDVQTGGAIKTFHGHTEEIDSVSISFNYTTIASGSDDSTICLWDIQTGECCCVIKIKLGSLVTCVSFYPTNPQHLISISDDGIVQQWGIDGHQIEPTYKGTHAAFSFDGTHLALCGEKVTTVQNFNSGAIVAKFPTDKDPESCCFSPNGRLVAVAAGVTAYVWDITGSDPHLIETFTGHTNSTTSLTFSSSSLISASHDQSIQFWQIGSSLAVSNPEPTPSASAPIQFVGLEAENGIAISSDVDGVVKTWDLSTGLCNASFQIPAKGGTLTDVKMVDDRLIVVWHEKSYNICIWDSKKEELLHRVTSEWAGARGLRISGDGSNVFCIAYKFVQGWSMLTGEAVGEVEVGQDSHLNPLHAKGSRIWVDLQNSPTQGWDFGISGSSPIPLSSVSSEELRLHFIPGISQWNNGPSRIEDTVTGKEVFQLPGRYARHNDVWWDGQYLVAGYVSGEVLILNFSQMLSQ
jgi:WD40 repeat protein